MATSYVDCGRGDPFDPATAKPGMAYTSEDMKRWANRTGGWRHPYIRFVCMHLGDPIFEYWDYNRYENGLPKGGCSQNFSIFATWGLVRDPEHDMIEE